jgi:hypothetical protein
MKCSAGFAHGFDSKFLVHMWCEWYAVAEVCRIALPNNLSTSVKKRSLNEVFLIGDLHAKMAAVAATMSVIDPNDSSKITFKLENASTPLLPKDEC